MIMSDMIEFTGIDQLIEEFGKFEDVGQDVKDEALIAGADVVKEQMKSEVYAHGLTRRSGEAEESIDRTDPEDDEIFIGPRGGAKVPGFYLYFHEFGYFNVLAGRFMPPKPFASIAFENAKGRVLEKQAEVYKRRMGM